MNDSEKMAKAEKIISISKTLFLQLPSETLNKIAPYFCGESICPPKVYFECNGITEKLLTGKGI